MTNEDQAAVAMTNSSVAAGPAVATAPAVTVAPTVAPAPTVGPAPAVTPVAGAATTPKEYTHAQKSEFVANMQTRLGDIHRDLNHLSAKVDKANDASKAEAKPKLQSLRDQAAKLNATLEEAKNATEATWGAVRESFDRSFAELKSGYQVTRQWVSDKVVAQGA